MKYMGKALNQVAGSGTGGGHHGEDMDDEFHAVRTPVICFKLLDLSKVQSNSNGGSGGGGVPVRSRPPARKASSQQAQQQQQQRQPRAAAPISAGAPRIPQQQTRQRPPVAKSTPPTADLMGFNSSSSVSSSGGRNLQHANSMPSVSSTPTGAKPGETRAEKLKREYAKKQATSNRVWDDVDQRWVEAGAKNGETSNAPLSKSNSSISNHGGVGVATAAVKGISLSRSNAVGKSANVQKAVEPRINDMESSQQKAIAELRIREAEKAKAESDEDLVRQRLEPKLKAWAEEHGQKKQLRALLANLHTILWEGSGWKQVSLADVLDDSKVKRVYFKASRVVHPDKTGHLDAEKRFVAKRAFDALTQAKVEWDNGKR